MPRAGLDRNKVVGAAARIADREGLHEVSLQAVANALGVKPPSLYSHVDGLEELRHLLSELALSELTEKLTQASMGLSGFELLHSVATAQRKMAAERPGLYAASLRHNRPRDDDSYDLSSGPENVFRVIVRSYGIQGQEADHAQRILRTSLDGLSLLDPKKSFIRSVDPENSFDRLVALMHWGFSSWSSVTSTLSDQPRV